MFEGSNTKAKGPTVGSKLGNEQRIWRWVELGQGEIDRFDKTFANFKAHKNHVWSLLKIQIPGYHHRDSDSAIRLGEN